MDGGALASAMCAELGCFLFAGFMAGVVVAATVAGFVFWFFF
jgi:hypothetical protein